MPASYLRTSPVKTAIACMFFLFAFPPHGQSQIITTVAGNGERMGSIGYWGDGGLALNASTAYPDDICMDTAGNLYLTCGNCVRKIDAVTNIITTIAGDGAYAERGDSGLAVNASMKYPDGLCIDKNGNLFVAEYGAHTVRKINLATGIITTVAGNGTEGFSGDNGPAVNAQLSRPNGICVDENNHLYIADNYNNRIRKVDLVTGIITTLVVGYYPSSVCLDGAGNIYSAQVTQVYKFNMLDGTSSIVAGNGIYDYSGDGGPATDASLNDVTGVYVDDTGNIYISEYDDSRIRKVDNGTGIITTIAGTGNNGYSGDNGPMLQADLHYPMGIISDGKGNLLVCDNQNSRIRKIAPLSTEWKGTVDNNWDNPLNWSGGTIPAQNMDVRIESGNVVINIDVVCGSLTVLPGASVTVSGNHTLTVSHAGVD
jgi:trimeric autotransporter adhesin